MTKNRYPIKLYTSLALFALILPACEAQTKRSADRDAELRQYFMTRSENRIKQQDEQKAAREAANLDKFLSDTSVEFELHPNFKDSKLDYSEYQLQLENMVIKGDAVAEYRLGDFYLKHGKTIQDKLHGIAWLQKSARQGNDNAHMALAYFYMNIRDSYYITTPAKKRAIYHLRESNNKTKAPYELASLYKMSWLFPEGEQPSDDEIFELYKLSAENGYPRARRKFVDIYSQGSLVARDMAEALKWAIIIDYMPNQRDESDLVKRLRSKMSKAEQALGEARASEYLSKTGENRP